MLVKLIKILNMLICCNTIGLQAVRNFLHPNFLYDKYFTSTNLILVLFNFVIFCLGVFRPTVQEEGGDIIYKVTKL